MDDSESIFLEKKRAHPGILTIISLLCPSVEDAMEKVKAKLESFWEGLEGEEVVKPSDLVTITAYVGALFA